MNVGRSRTVFPTLALLAAMVCATAAAAQPFPPGPGDRRDRVAGWRIVHVYDEDGGRDVGLSISREDVAIDYFANYWRGNGRPFRRASIMRSGENCAGEQWNEGEPSSAFAPEPDIAGDERRLRERLTGYLAECGVGPGQAERLLRGFTPAFARLAAFAESARRYTNAVNCSIANYGEPPQVVRNRCHRRR